MGALREEKKLASQQFIENGLRKKNVEGVANTSQGTDIFEVLFPCKFCQRVSTFVPFFSLFSFWPVMFGNSEKTGRSYLFLPLEVELFNCSLVPRRKMKRGPSYPFLQSHGIFGFPNSVPMKICQSIICVRGVIITTKLLATFSYSKVTCPSTTRRLW